MIVPVIGNENIPSSPDIGSQTATPPQPAETLGFSQYQTATKDRVVAVRESLKPTESVTCGGVAVWNGESGDAHVAEPDLEPSEPIPDADDIEREAIQNEAEDDIEREPVGHSYEQIKI